MRGRRVEEQVVPDVCPICGDWARLFEVYERGHRVRLGCEDCLRRMGWWT